MSISFLGPSDPSNSESEHLDIWLACIFKKTLKDEHGVANGPTMREATEQDLYRAGYTPQSVAMSEIKQRFKTIKVLTRRNLEILETLKSLVIAVKETQEGGFTFEEFTDQETIQEALKQAEEILEEEDMEP